MNRTRQKSHRKHKKRRVQTHKKSVLAILAVIIMLTVVASVNGMNLRAKEKAYQAQITELEKEIAQEEARTAEIDELEDYMDTDEYVEEIAREKLGLVYENEIIFKAK